MKAVSKTKPANLPLKSLPKTPSQTPPHKPTQLLGNQPTKPSQGPKKVSRPKQQNTKPPQETVIARKQQTALIKQKQARELTYGPIGANSNTNTGPTTEGGAWTPYLV